MLKHAALSFLYTMLLAGPTAFGAGLLIEDEALSALVGLSLGFGLSPVGMMICDRLHGSW